MSWGRSALTHDMGAVLEEGHEIVARVEALSSTGKGIFRADGRVWFVPGVLPGDRVRVRAGRVHPRWIEGFLVERIEGSSERREPPCPVQGACGGCPLMPLDEERQRSWKRRFVADALERIGGRTTEVDPVVPGPAFAYRNKVELSLGPDAAGEAALGFRPPGGGAVVDVAACAVQHRDADVFLAALRRRLFLADRPWSRAFRSGRVRLTLRRSESTGEILLGVSDPRREFRGLARFADELAEESPALAGVVRIRGTAGRRGGRTAQALVGRDRLSERIDRVDFVLPAVSFLQVNVAVATALVRRVREWIAPETGPKVLDLYAGVGTIALNLAATGARVRSCEADREAVRAARVSASRNRIRACRASRAEVATFVAAGRADGADAAVVNPPRTGMARPVAEWLAREGPGKVVVVSCDPATLARDVARLGTGGFRVVRAVPFDMFPQTAHVETAVLLERAPQSDSGM